MKQPHGSYDGIVLGAGAAGLMCAAVAGQRGRQILLIDHADRPGKKILISGGGRCNFTNLETTHERFLSFNPHFAKSALGRFHPADFIALVDRYNIAWHEKTLGQLFCDQSASQIVAMLLEECAKGQVDIRLGLTVGDIAYRDNCFAVSLGSDTAIAPALVLATGGPAIPKMGATGFAYDVAQQFGLAVVPPRPALVPLTLGPGDQDFTELTGVSAMSEVAFGKSRFREALLFTHRGLSGPAILQISSYWLPGQDIIANLIPKQSPEWLVQSKRDRPDTSLRSALAEVLPGRLAKTLERRVGAVSSSTMPLGQIKDRDLRKIVHQLANWHFTPSGTEGFAKAEVTAGGIDTDELSSRTMQAKALPGLYAIGEAVDV
ncbi:MAG: NAD(P)/FAD-dependent oxidoreductase, partial [Hyphomicrobiaceae bacterium]